MPTNVKVEEQLREKEKEEVKEKEEKKQKEKQLEKQMEKEKDKQQEQGEMEKLGKQDSKKHLLNCSVANNLVGVVKGFDLLPIEFSLK